MSVWNNLFLFSTIVFPVPIDIMASFMQNQQSHNFEQDLQQQIRIYQELQKYQQQQQHQHQQQHQQQQQSFLRGQVDIKSSSAQVHRAIRPPHKTNIKVIQKMFILSLVSKVEA